MLKTAATILALLLVGSLVSNYIFWGKSKEKIEKAEQDLKEYKTQYQTVIDKGDSLDVIVKSLREQEETLQSRIAGLEGVVDSLKSENEKAIKRVANLFQPDDLVDEMRATFPELKTAPIGVARVPHPETGFRIRTFQVPIQFVATFIADHQEVDNFKKQMAALVEINFTYKDYVVLQDSIITLKDQKADAYKEGLDYGIKMFEQLTKDYISTLKNPPKIGLLSNKLTVLGILAGAAAGYAVVK